MRSLLLIASALLAAPVLAQTPGSCEVGTARSYLDVSDTQVELVTTGALFGDAGYIVPKKSGAFPVYTARLWMSGIVDADVRAFWSTWGRPSLWPGPLNDGAVLPSVEDCSAYDRIWTVSTYDLAIYEATGVASSDLMEWPVGLGAPTVDAEGRSVAATSRSQMIELAKGERPVISGTQTAFWIMNDVGNQNVAYMGGGEYRPVSPLGVEVAVTAFALASDIDALNQTTVYRFRVINRNTRPIEDAHLGIVAVPAVNGSHENMVGVDTTRHLAFAYSGSNRPQDYEVPPAVGIDLFRGLSAHTTIADGGPRPINLPPSPEAIHARLQGRWNDGTPILEDGFGYAPYGADGPVTRFAFPGDPVTQSFWSMVNSIDGGKTNVGPSDWYNVLGSPRFTLQPGESTDFELAVVFAQGTDRFDAITELRAASDLVQAAYDEGSLFEPTAATPLLERPVLLRPASGSAEFDSTVAFQWNEVPDAERYRLDLSISPSFRDTTTYYIEGTTADIHIPFWLVGNEPMPVYWRVRAENAFQRSPSSESHAVEYYRYIPRIRYLSDETPAFVEVVGPGGIDPCGPEALTRTGCDEVGGHAVSETLNSTGAYQLRPRAFVSTRSARNPASEFEIRMTGSSFAHATTDRFVLVGHEPETERLVEVPFEIWDIGPTPPGEENDSSDDTRLIPILTSWSTIGDSACDFTYSTHVLRFSAPANYDTVRATKRISGSYPRESYDAFAQYAEQKIQNDSNRCPEVPADSVYSYLYQSEGRVVPDDPPLFGVQFQDPSDPRVGMTTDLTGAVIRFYTTDPYPITDEATPRAGGLTLGPAYPNPATSSLTIPYRLTSPSTVELAVYDVLGRRVLELANTRQPEGDHTAMLNASTLAPGIYVIRMRAGDETRTTRVTVVR